MQFQLQLLAISYRLRVNIHAHNRVFAKSFIFENVGNQEWEIAMSCADVQNIHAVSPVFAKVADDDRMSEDVCHVLSIRNRVGLILVRIFNCREVLPIH